MAVTHGVTARNAATNAVVALLDGGAAAGKLVFRISPSSVGSPGTAAATLTLSDPAFDAAGSAGGNADGVAAADPITSDTNAAGNASAVAYATLQDSNDVIIIHCAVTASSGDINLSNGLTVANGDTVSCSSLTYAALSG